jgi:hypothetical protein
MMQRYQVGDEPKKGSVITEVMPGGMGVIYVVELGYGGSSFKRAIKSCDVERGLAPDFRATFERESLLWISLPPILELSGRFRSSSMEVSQIL